MKSNRDINMLKKILITGLITSSLLFAGCASNPSSAQQQHNLASLQNKTWVLTHFGATEFKSSPTARNIPSIQFDEATKRVSGADGCNRIIGSYTIQGEHITLSQLGGTKMLCAETMNLANQYNEALEKVTGYQVYDKTLRLLDRHGNPLLQFSSAVQAR